MSEKSPAFQFYVKDWLGSQRVRLLTPEQRGCYIDLMSHCWDGPGLPDDLEELEILSGYKGSDFEERIWKKLKQFFYKNTDEKLHHERLDDERKKQKKYSQKQRDAAKAMHAKRLASMPRHSHGTATAQPENCRGSARAGSALHLQSSSSFSSSSLKESQKEKDDSFSEPEQKQKPKIELRPPDSKTFLSQYQERELRAHLKAVFVVRGWDQTPGLEESVYSEVLKRVKDSEPRMLFPYFKKSLQNYINENAEYLTRQAKESQEKSFT